MSLVVRNGAAAVVVTGDLGEWAMAAIRNATGGAVDAIRAQLQPVADKAAAEWYSANGVERVTGLSGDMAVITTLDEGKGVVRVSVGSTDVRPAGKKGALVPHFVHRPGRLAHRLKVVSRVEFYAAPQSTRVGRARKAQPGINVGDYLVRERSVKASDGKMLIPLFVNAPAKLAIKNGVSIISAAMAIKMNGTAVPK